MIRKHTLHGLWRRFQDVSIIVLVVAFLISGAVSIIALRNNNLTMTKLREAVYVADTNGGDIEAALRELRVFVYGHMNTNLRAGSSSSEPPIQLVTRFNTAVEAARQKAAAANNATKVYADAQAQCERGSLPLTARAQCIQDYVSQNGNGIPQLELPPKDFYTFDFVSPLWSPDIAGWSLVITAVLGLAIIARLLSGVFIKLYLRK